MRASRSARWATTGAAMILLMTACGGKDAAVSPKSKGGDATTTTAPPSGHTDDPSHDGTPHAHDGPPEAKYSAANPPPEKFRPPDDTSGEPGTLPLEARITPGCVEWGGTVKFELKTAPGADYAMQVKWPNEQFSDLPSTYGKADKDGKATWSVDVKPTALTGEAHLQVAAIIPSSGERGSSGDFRFLVGRPGRC